MNSSSLEFALPELLQRIAPLFNVQFEYDIQNPKMSISYALHQITYKLIQQSQLYVSIPTLLCG